MTGRTFPASTRFFNASRSEWLGLASYQYLLKAQVDYLMMSGLLIVFFRSRPAALFDFWVQSIESQRRNIHETT